MLSILFGTSIDTLVKGDVTVMEEAVERNRQAHGNADAMAGRADARVAGGGVRTDTVAGV